MEGAPELRNPVKRCWLDESIAVKGRTTMTSLERNRRAKIGTKKGNTDAYGSIGIETRLCPRNKMIIPMKTTKFKGQSSQRRLAKGTDAP